MIPRWAGPVSGVFFVAAVLGCNAIVGNEDITYKDLKATSSSSSSGDPGSTSTSSGDPGSTSTSGDPGSTSTSGFTSTSGSGFSSTGSTGSSGSTSGDFQDAGFEGDD